MSIGDEKYVSFTTFRKNGDAKPAPVWIADLGDGTLGFTTEADAWKVKRLANNNRVQMQPCNSRGKVAAGDVVVDGSAVVVGSGADFDRVDAAIGKKYGYQRKLVQASSKIRGLFGKAAATCAVIVTLDEG